jgi:hypothetical protein
MVELRKWYIQQLQDKSKPYGVIDCLCWRVLEMQKLMGSGLGRARLYSPCTKQHMRHLLIGFVSSQMIRIQRIEWNVYQIIEPLY